MLFIRQSRLTLTGYNIKHLNLWCKNNFDTISITEEVLQRILENDNITNENANFTENMMTESPEITPETPSNENSNSKESLDSKKKPLKRFECPQCGKVFHHRNSLLYHLLSHSGKQHVCRECGKGFYTVTALKVCI